MKNKFKNLKKKEYYQKKKICSNKLIYKYFKMKNKLKNKIVCKNKNKSKLNYRNRNKRIMKVNYKLVIIR